MALYIYQAAYTSESVAAQIKEPKDRLEAVRPGIETIGTKILVGGNTLREYDVLVVHAPDDTTAASVALAVAAGGARQGRQTAELLSGQEWIEALRKAQVSQYRPAR